MLTLAKSKDFSFVATVKRTVDGVYSLQLVGEKCANRFGVHNPTCQTLFPRMALIICIVFKSAEVSCLIM